MRCIIGVQPRKLQRELSADDGEVSACAIQVVQLRHSSGSDPPSMDDAIRTWQRPCGPLAQRMQTGPPQAHGS